MNDRMKTRESDGEKISAVGDFFLQSQGGLVDGGVSGGTPMNLVIGLSCIMLARAFAAIYGILHAEFAGRLAVQLCCRAYFSGTGTDAPVIEIVQEMGADGARLLKMELRNSNRKRAAAMILGKLIR